jgi:hypothetical protein
MANGNLYFDPQEYMWPDDERRVVAPVRVGVDRITGKVLMGEAHEDQSILTLFATRYHERVLRRWVGSFVPHLLGESAIERVIARFWWAIITAIELWEPNFRIRRVRMQSREDGSRLTSAEELRRGHVTFVMEGIRRPRGHLGDETEEVRRSFVVTGAENRWRREA